jgi:hypothetical protein
MIIAEKRRILWPDERSQVTNSGCAFKPVVVTKGECLALTDPDPNILKSAAAYLVQVARSSKGGRYRKSAKIDAPEGAFNPLAQVQFGQGAFPEFSQSLLLTTAFEDEDSGSTELAEVLPAIAPPPQGLRRDKPYAKAGTTRTACRAVGLAKAGVRNAKREAPGENARKRSSKRTARALARP